MFLDRLHGFLEHEQHNHRKGQLPLAREIFFPHAMASPKLGIVQPPAQVLDKSDEISGNGLKDDSHPHFAYTLYLLCTFKSETRCALMSYFNASVPLPSLRAVKAKPVNKRGERDQG